MYSSEMEHIVSVKLQVMKESELLSRLFSHSAIIILLNV